MDALRLMPGEHVLDIGCGIGGTPAALSRRVGNTGRVTGLELLQPAVDVACRDEDRPANVDFLCGDAETHAFPPGAHDAVFSRFGVMFFRQPVAAFRNLHLALRKGGRIGFVCWRGLEENELDLLPLRAAAPALPADLVSGSASATWFSFSDPGRISAILSKAGFVDIGIAPHDEMVSSGSLEATIDVCSRVGALGAMLREHPHLREAAVPLLAEALRERDGPAGPTLRAATWIVTAAADRQV